MRVFNVLAFYCALLPHATLSQHLALKTYSRAAGLASDYIFCITQDRQGFMWFGTDRGVSVFDGHRFQTFTTRDGLPSNLIYKIHQSQNGDLWFATYERGPCRMTNGRFVRLVPENSTMDQSTVGIAEDQFGRIYFGYGDGIGVFHRDSLSWIRTQGRSSGVIFFHRSHLYAVTESGLLRITPTNDHRIVTSNVTLISPTPVGRIVAETHSWLFTHEGELWLGRSGGILRYNISATEDSIHYLGMLLLPKGWSDVFALARGEGDVVWAATRNGLLRIFDGNVFPYDERDGIDPEFLQTLFRDAEGTLWLGTFGGGVKKLINDKTRLYTTASGIAGNNVTAILADSRGNIWYGGNTFLGMLSPTGVPAFSNPHFIEVRSFAEDSSGGIYVGTFTSLFGPHPPEAYRQRVAPGPRIGSGVSSMYVAPDSAMWFGSYGGGAYTLNRAVMSNLKTDEGLPSLIIERVIEGRNSIWFLSLDAGAARMRNGKFDRFSKNEGLPSNNISWVLEDSLAIWFGTPQGLVRWSQQSNRVEQVLPLSGGVVWIGRMSASVAGLWILTERSLYRLLDGDLKSYGSALFNPLASATITQVTHRTADNSLWIATTSGIISLDLASISENTTAPPVSITRMLLDTVSVYSHLGGIAVAFPNLRFAHDQNNISISYAGLSFADEADVRYLVKLEPVESDWSRSTSEREVRYRNLGPGVYTFSVIATNSGAAVSVRPATITFTIQPPFWMTPWFIGLCIVLAAGAFGGIVRYASVRQLRRELQRLERERALQAERERISRDLHDNVGSQLVNIISGLDLVEKYSSVPELRARRLLQVLQQDARTSLLQLRETIWAIKTPGMTLDKFCAQVEEYSRRQLEFHEGIELRFQQECVFNATMAPAQVLGCFRIVQEAITNCVKHARADVVTLRVATRAGELLITVSDDGPGGFSSDAETHGNGLRNMRSRAEELGGACVILSERGKGTSVTVRVPLATSQSSSAS